MSRPLQNRVHPSGEIVSAPERGTMMGNRGGRIHNDVQKLTKDWASKQWICCVLNFNNRQRTVMGPFYTELFFLDEATALAAGHRPCFECRRSDALAFSTIWAKVRGRSTRAKIAEIDEVLHEERLGPFETVDSSSIPVGALFRQDQNIYLQSQNGPRNWSFSGYDAPETHAGPVEAITPKSIREILAAGYRPKLHPTAT